jgi:hypothetical protein
MSHTAFSLPRFSPSRALLRWACLPAFVLLVALTAPPCAAQDGDSETVSAAEATDALAQAMRARGLTPPSESDLSLEDHISTHVDGSNQHVSLTIGPDGHAIPSGEWQDLRRNYCKRQARYMRGASTLLDFEIYRNRERLDGVVRNQLFVFARLIDVESGKSIEQREGKASNITGEQRASEGYAAEALEAAFAKMERQPKAPDGPCGEVRLKHVEGEKVNDAFVFRAGFRGFGKALVYTWDFGDGSETAVGRSLQRATHVYDAEGTYEVSVRVEGTAHGKPIEPGVGTVSVTVGGGLTLFFSSKIEQGAHGGEYQAISRYEADIALTPGENSTTYEGKALLRNVEHFISLLEGAPCTAQPGSAGMSARVTLPEEAPATQVEVVLVVDEAFPEAALSCEYPGIAGRFRRMATVWWPGFAVMHEGDFGKGGFLVTGWEWVDDPVVVARKVYSGSLSRESVTMSEETTIEIRRE